MCQNQTHLTLQLLNANFIKGLNLLKMHIGRMYSVLLEKIFDIQYFWRRRSIYSKIFLLGNNQRAQCMPTNEDD